MLAAPKAPENYELGRKTAHTLALCVLSCSETLRSKDTKPLAPRDIRALRRLRHARTQGCAYVLAVLSQKGGTGKKPQR